MRIFVTGATGLLGRTLVPELIEHGHDVIGLARSDASRSMLSAMHAAAYSDQGHDIDRMTEALEAVHAIVHLATSMPNSDAAVEDDWAHSSKIVLGMLRVLVEASERSGVRTIIFPSFYGIYADHGADWVNEESRIDAADSASESYLEAEQLLHDTNAARHSIAVVLRMGQLYSAEAPHTRGLLYALSNRLAATSPAPQAYWPMVHVEDAAQAIRLALELSPAGQTFNICDDDPVPKSQLYTDLAGWIKAPPPPERTGTGPLSPYMGRIDAAALHKSVRMSNRKAREWLGFVPKYSTYREGFPQIVESWLARSQNA